MASVTKAASINTVVTTGWTSPTNAYGTSADGTFATATPAKSSTVNTDYGFASFTTGDIPDGSTISSVVITVAWKLSSSSVGGTLGVQGRNNGVADSAAEVTDTTDTAVTQKTFTFGTIPALADLRNAGQVVARVRDSRLTSNTAHTGSLDFVSLTVNYTPPTAVSDSSTGSLTDSSTLTAQPSDTASASASETNTIAGTGSDADSAGVSPTASVSASLSATDSGSLAESAIVGIPVSSSDTGQASEASATVAASLSASDTESVASAETLVRQSTDTDSLTATSSSSAAAALTDTDTPTLTDTPAPAASVTASDIGALTDDGSVSSQGSTQNISDTDTYSLGDAASLAGAFAAVDAGAATDAQALAAACAVLDILTEAEAVTLAAALIDTDTDTLTDDGNAAPPVVSITGEGTHATSQDAATTVGEANDWTAEIASVDEATVIVDEQ